MADYTYASVYWMYSLMALFVVGALFFMARAWQTGAMTADEAPKYRMLEDDDVAPAGPADAPAERRQS